MSIFISISISIYTRTYETYAALAVRVDLRAVCACALNCTSRIPYSGCAAISPAHRAILYGAALRIRQRVNKLVMWHKYDSINPNRPDSGAVRHVDQTPV